METIEISKKRPGIVIFAAILNFVSCGIFLLGAVLALLAALFGNVLGFFDFLSHQVDQYAATPNYTYGLLFLSIILTIVFLLFFLFFILTGFGLLKAKKWAWYVQVTLSVFALAGFFSTAILTFAIPALSLHAIIQLTILILFFRPPVREYFKV